MGGQRRNAVVRPLNRGSCFAGVKSFRDEDSEGPARVERGRSMISIAGPGMGISRHQPRCLGVGAVGCEAGCSVKAGSVGAFDCQQRRRGAPARARRLFPLGPVNPCRDLQSRGGRARRVDRPAGCSGRRGRPRGFPGIRELPRASGGVASGPGPPPGEGFCHDDDAFPGIDRRHRQYPRRGPPSGQCR